jgi:hypothetical protein
MQSVESQMTFQSYISIFMVEEKVEQVALHPACFMLVSFWLTLHL